MDIDKGTKTSFQHIAVQSCYNEFKHIAVSRYNILRTGLYELVTTRLYSSVTTQRNNKGLNVPRCLLHVPRSITPLGSMLTIGLPELTLRLKKHA